MSGESKRTKDHTIIKNWIEARGGIPSTIAETGNGEPGVLRIDFPGMGNDNLEHISWQKFFETFDKRDLTFLYQEKTASGRISRFFKFIRENDN